MCTNGAIKGFGSKFLSILTPIDKIWKLSKIGTFGPYLRLRIANFGVQNTDPSHFTRVIVLTRNRGVAIFPLFGNFRQA